MLLAEQGLQKKERCCATNYVGQHTAHMYKLNLMIRLTRGVWCSLRFTMRRMDQWSKRTSSMCTLDCMSPRLCFRVDISKKILNAHWMHIECTLNAHWLCWLCSCSNAILGAVQTIVLSALCSGSVLCQGQDYKIFDEILVNAADNFVRDNSQTYVKAPSWSDEKEA